MLDLDPIRERVENATPGLWVIAEGDPHEITSADGQHPRAEAEYPEDAELIAHAPTDLADLIAEVERLREEVARQQNMPCAKVIAGLRAQIERVRATLHPGDADPLNDPYARGYAHHSREVREALEGTDNA